MSNPNNIDKGAEFNLARIGAIDSYSMLELSLCMLVATLLGISVKQGVAIVSRMVNTRSRYGLIEDLLTQSEHTKYRKFWAGIEKLLKPLDVKRNHFVHWLSVADHGVVGGNNTKQDATFTMQSPAGYLGKDSPTYSIHDFHKFQSEVEGVVTMINYYSGFLAGKLGGSNEALREIFLRPATHQTKEALLQALIHPEEQPPPPQSSQV